MKLWWLTWISHGVRDNVGRFSSPRLGFKASEQPTRGASVAVVFGWRGACLTCLPPSPYFFNKRHLWHGTTAAGIHYKETNDIVVNEISTSNERWPSDISFDDEWTHQSLKISTSTIKRLIPPHNPDYFTLLPRPMTIQTRPYEQILTSHPSKFHCQGA